MQFILVLSLFVLVSLCFSSTPIVANMDGTSGSSSSSLNNNSGGEEQHHQNPSKINIIDDPPSKLFGKNPGRFDMKPGPGTFKGHGPHRKFDLPTRGAEKAENREGHQDDNEHSAGSHDWSHLVGKHSDEAKTVITNDMPGVRAVVVPEVMGFFSLSITDF